MPAGTTWPLGRPMDMSGIRRKYSFRVLSCLLTALVASLSACNNERHRNPANHSAENNSPHSILEGRTIRVEPYGATFDIPESWLTPQAIPGEPSKNLYLNWQELDYLYRNDGADAEDAQVINSVLSFQDCAAHVADKAWGNHLWNDLQVRVYVTDATTEEIAGRVEKQGLAEASEVFEHASVVSGTNGAWNKKTLDVIDAPPGTDFILGKRVDFYYRSFTNKTVVFVFLHAGGFDETISSLLDSFKWPVSQ
ncbi:MAG TPA: hypothetical protein VFZ40_17995 [Pyrinomonadaceae bacterium]